MQALGREREEGREQHLETVDDAQRDVEDRPGALAVGLQLRPRCLLGDVLVAERRRAASPPGVPLRKRAASIRRADRVESTLDLMEQGFVVRRERRWRRNRTEVLVRALERPIDEVAPRRDELVVVPPNELGPREVRVLSLRAGNGQEVAQRVGVVPAQEVAHEDLHAATRAELLPLHRQEFARGDVVRELQGAAPRAVRRHRFRTRAACSARSRCGRRCCPSP